MHLQVVGFKYTWLTWNVHDMQVFAMTDDPLVRQNRLHRIIYMKHRECIVGKKEK